MPSRHFVSVRDIIPHHDSCLKINSAILAIMTDINTRIQNAKKEITGNEALLDMLDADAATEMLNWGIAMAASVAGRTEGMDDAEADLVITPGLKAARQALRSMGNWATGKYVEAEDRVQLRDRLLEQFKLIVGDKSKLPNGEALGRLLNEVDDSGNLPHQLILKLKTLIEKTG